MRRSPFFLFAALFLAACTQTASVEFPIAERLKNPLVAERYWAEMAEHMADFVRTNHALSKDTAARGVIDAEKNRSLSRLAEARKKKEAGLFGSFIEGIDPVQGGALLLDSTVYFGSDFLAYPEPEQHVYVTTLVDPRGGEFPDATSADLGELESPYGAQQYSIPSDRMDPRFRTLVLYDRRLNVITAIAQLSQ